MPNGYGTAMKIFAKTSKVLSGHLRSQINNSVVYVDNSYIQGGAYQFAILTF